MQADPGAPKGSYFRDEDDASNPYAAPTVSAGGLKPLGSLAQSARLKQLNVARFIMLFVGVVTIAFNAFMYSRAERDVDQAIQAGLIDPAARDEVIGAVRLIYGGAAAVGVVFIVLGIVVKRFPVPATVLGLILYLAGQAGFAYLDINNLYQGIILKIIIVVALVKAVQAAFAYQSEQRELEADHGFA